MVQEWMGHADLSTSRLYDKRTFRADFCLFGGLTAGYIDTNYYAGAAGAPFSGFGYQRLSFNVIYLPFTDCSDELQVGLISIKVFEW